VPGPEAPGDDVDEPGSVGSLRGGHQLPFDHGPSLPPGVHAQ
jgi:hypothetical protein